MLRFTHGMSLFCALSCLLLTVPLSMAIAAPLPAPTFNPGDQDLIRDRQNRLLEEQQRRLEELKDLPGKSAAPVAPSAPSDSRCFPIQDIQLKGADSLS
ncbi:ShlB/FhaC/HecB family hemolysin secretion/activation protein, partial [Pseudomonas protegens]|nr:ShlB/FhaC/HecB family hemolysin secretion/activation protein [Pseudomonas protegens]